MPSAGMMTVEWQDLFTRDMSLLADTLGCLYADQAARFSCPDPGRAEGRLHQGAVSGLSAALVHYGGFIYTAEIPLRDTPMATVCRTGFQAFSAGGDERRLSDGQVFLTPGGVPLTATAGEGDYSVLGVPMEAVGALAEETFGLSAGDLRFEAMAPPLSAAQQHRFARTAEFVCAELVTREASEISALQVAALTRQTAAAFLGTFPSNVTATGYQAGPGWVATAAVRRATEFIEAHADQPLTVDQIAAAAGVGSTALLYAFRRHFDATPTGYLYRVRLERAHQELEAAAPGSDLAVAAVARRWGWLSVGQFVVSYQRHFGVPPGQPRHR
jgi:AraC-like DNA-binding protein